MKRAAAVVVMVMSGCAGLTTGQVSLLQPPGPNAFAGRGCTMTVAPVDFSQYTLDEKAPPPLTPDRERAFKEFDSRFYRGVSITDPAHVARGTSGTVVLQPVVKKIVSGQWFADAASNPTEVWLEVKVLSADGQVLERVESHALENASKRSPSLEDRLPQTGQLLGQTLGKYVRKELSCR